MTLNCHKMALNIHLERLSCKDNCVWGSVGVERGLVSKKWELRIKYKQAVENLHKTMQLGTYNNTGIP